MGLLSLVLPESFYNMERFKGSTTKIKMGLASDVVQAVSRASNY